MDLKNKFSKLGKIAALSFTLGTAALGNADAQAVNFPEYRKMNYDGKEIIFQKGHITNSVRLNDGRIKPTIVQNNITVTYPDGKIITYADVFGDDKAIDRIIVMNSIRDITVYDNTPENSALFQKGQKEYNLYLSQLNESKK